MGSCITKPTHPRRQSSLVLLPFNTTSQSYVAPVAEASGPGQIDQGEEILLAVSEEGEIAPFRVSISEGEMEYSDSEAGGNWADYEADRSLRDSLEILREERRCKEHRTSNSTGLKAQDEIAQLKQAIAALKSAPARNFACFLCETGRPKVLFRPCRHLICCHSCSLQVLLCPVCKHTILAREEVFL